MDKSKKYRLIKDFPTRHIGDTIYYNNKIEKWFWEKGGAIPEDLLRDLEGFPKIDEWFEEIEELCVPIGTKFKVSGDNTIYSISKIIDSKVIITWGNSLDKMDTYYDVEDVNKYFKDGSWVKYKEPEYYEILSIRKVKDKGMSNSIEEWTPESSEISLDAMLYLGYCVYKGDYYIHSIRRTSDDEVFTIGDIILRNDIYHRGIIKKFEIQDDELKVYLKEIIIGLPLDNIENIKSLFTTEDGIDICKGDKYYFICDNDNPYIDFWTVKEHVVNWENPKTPPLGKVQFGIEANAEKYIKENKPRYSYRQINDIVEKLDLTKHQKHYFYKYMIPLDIKE